MLAFRPYLINALRGYSRERLIKDRAAGLTVGVVALPLSMAFAIASGLKPEAGLFTAIIAGILISALGGSRVQIGGPAGAFIVIVYGIVQQYGVANLIIATAMSGVFLFAMGFFKMGTLVRFVPIALIIGFTNGIAVLIALSQVRDFLGLSVQNMPANFFGMLSTLQGALSTINWYATVLASVCLAGLAIWQFVIPKVFSRNPWTARLTVMPGSVVALITATLCVLLFDLPVETIGKRFGGIPSDLPSLAWPDFDWGNAQHMFIPALTLALLGAIESLLCARVADGLIDDRHNPNQELMAQGIANFVTPFFGGMPATGTIARTVTNVKSGATSPISGIVHGLALLVIVLIAAPLATHIPLCAMAAILMYVAWNMGEWREFAHLWRFRIPYRIILLSVFLLTVMVDLTVAVQVGLVAAFITFVYRISSLSRCEAVPLEDHPCVARQVVSPGSLAAYRVYGALFFGAVTLIENMRDQLPRQTLLLDLKNVIYIDASGGDTLNDLAHACQKNGVELVVCGLSHQPLEMATRCGFTRAVGAKSLHPDLATALAYVGSQGETTEVQSHATC